MPRERPEFYRHVSLGFGVEGEEQGKKGTRDTVHLMVAPRWGKPVTCQEGHSRT